MSQKLTRKRAAMARVFHEFGFTEGQLAKEYGVRPATMAKALAENNLRSGHDGEVDRGSGQEDLL